LSHSSRPQIREVAVEDAVDVNVVLPESLMVDDAVDDTVELSV
jgi:hypothetical protein